MSAGQTVARVNHVTLGYGSLTAVRDVSFTLDRGEYVFLIGRNGCGKSTLIKGMVGLLEPRSGSIELPGGPDSTAYLPQTLTVDRDFPATVREVALSGRQRSRWTWRYSREDREAAERALELMGIPDLAGQRMGDLSGGQRQRALLARCLCRRPDLLLLDEPYTGLDAQAAADLTGLLLSLRERRGIAILMSSHDLGAVAACASRILVLEQELVFDGDVGEWLDRFKSGRRPTRTACGPAAALAGTDAGGREAP